MANKFIRVAPTLVHDFSEAPGDWSLHNFAGADGSIQRGGDWKTGTGSLRVINNATSEGGARYHLDGSFDFSGTESSDDLIHLILHFESGDRGQTLGEGVGVKLYISDSAGWTNYAYTNTMMRFRDDRPEWVTLSLKKSDFRYFGSWTDSSWNSAAGRIGIQVSNYYSSLIDHAGHYGDATFDALYVGGSGPVPVTFSFDDNHLVQNDMIADLESYGWHTSIVACSDFIDRPGNSNPTRMSLDDMRTHESNGHRIILHGFDHSAIDSPTDPPTAGQIATVITSLGDGYLELDSWFNNLTPYYASTRGAFNQEVIDYVTNDLNMIAHRDARSSVAWDITPDGTNDFFAYGSLFDLSVSDNRWDGGCFRLESDDAFTGTAALAIAEIDRCVARNCAVHIYLHQVVVGAGAGQMERADWLAVLAHIETLERSGAVIPMGWHEWMNELTGYDEGSHKRAVPASLPKDVNGKCIPTLAPMNTKRADPTTEVRVILPKTPNQLVAQLVRITSDGDLYLEFGDSTVTASGASIDSFLFLKGTEVFTVPSDATFLGFTDLAGGTAASIIEVTRLA